MEEATGAPSSFAACSPRRPRASSRDGGGVMNRPPSPLTMLLSRHTRRRDFLSIVGGSTAWPLAARAQAQRKAPRIGVLDLSPTNSEPGLRRGLRELGYVE